MINYNDNECIDIRLPPLIRTSCAGHLSHRFYAVILANSKYSRIFRYLNRFSSYFGKRERDAMSDIERQIKLLKINLRDTFSFSLSLSEELRRQIDLFSLRTRLRRIEDCVAL